MYLNQKEIRMPRKSITFAEKQDEWLKLVVASGYYKDESDYIRDLVRHDQEKRSKLIEVRAAIQEGLDSGVSDKSLDQIWSQVEDEYKAKGNE